MYASKKILLKALLSLCATAMLLAAPYTFAKKDLFANEPGSNHATQTQRLVTNSAAPADANNETATLAQVEIKPAPAVEKKPSYIETQLTRLKGHLVETKEDLFGSKTSSKKVAPEKRAVVEKAENEEHAGEDVQPELPVISATEAAQRAQTYAEGQVINVRQYQDEGNQRYAVKLLQKNGRMKTINLNAVTGELIEETTE
ncbi:MAG: hypothetical protein ABW044_09930 [Cellvibrio sp.]